MSTSKEEEKNEGSSILPPLHPQGLNGGGGGGGGPSTSPKSIKPPQKLGPILTSQAFASEEADQEEETQETTIKETSSSSTHERKRRTSLPSDLRKTIGSDKIREQMSNNLGGLPKPSTPSIPLSPASPNSPGNNNNNNNGGKEVVSSNTPPTHYRRGSGGDKYDRQRPASTRHDRSGGSGERRRRFSSQGQSYPSSDDESVNSTLSNISMPYLQLQQEMDKRKSNNAKSSNNINLTHVYQELHIHTRRKETVKEIMEFHASKRKLQKSQQKAASNGGGGTSQRSMLWMQAASNNSLTGGTGSGFASPLRNSSFGQLDQSATESDSNTNAKDTSFEPASSPESPRQSLSRDNSASAGNFGGAGLGLMQGGSSRRNSLGTPRLPDGVESVGSSATTLEITNRLKKKNRFTNRAVQTIIRLPRGGVIVNTRIGPIQVGMPPETIKDSMNLGLKIPTIFVVPQQRFHRWRMISVAEFEFPAYFNFFVKNLRVRLVTTKSAEVALRAAFQESLLGPVDLSMEAIANDFDPNLPLDLRPNIHVERKFFGKNNIDKLLDFVTLKEVRNQDYLEADLGDGIFVRLESKDGEDYYVVVDKKKKEEEENATGTFVTNEIKPKKRMTGHKRSNSDIAQFPDAPTRRHVRRNSNLGNDVLVNADVAKEAVLGRISDSVELPNFRTFGLLDTRPDPFVPPSFGVTFLGTSHGFDPKSSTTGFVVWINGVGMLVDPPPNSGPMLELMGIPPRMIRTVLVTHCHADHDAGTMQKIMLDENVTVVTTPTIVNSFMRKYSAITGMSVSMIRKRFIFRPARVGQFMDIFGGEIRVFYAFHTIPCVGFEVRFGGKSVVYSADTFYDPEAIKALCADGTLTSRRAEALLDFPFDADLVLHECGVPPIHTPLRCLEALSEENRARLRLVHVTASQVKDSCLLVAGEGVENTLVLDTNHRLPPLASAITVVGWIRDAAPLRDLSIVQLMELLTVMRLCTFQEGECVTDSVLNDSFLVIGSGGAALFPPGRVADKAEEGRGRAGGREAARAAIQGDTSLLSQGDCVFVGGQMANPEDRPKIIATSQQLRCALFQIADVECFARQGNTTNNLLGKWRREAALTQIFAGIRVLDCLTLRQRALFASMFSEKEFQPGQVLWKAGEHPTEVFVVTSGVFELERRSSSAAVNENDSYDPQQVKESNRNFGKLQSQLREFHRGKTFKELLIDLPALYHDLPLNSDLFVSPASSLEARGFVASAADLLSFLRATPTLLFRMHAEYISEIHLDLESSEEEEEEEEDA